MMTPAFLREAIRLSIEKMEGIEGGPCEAVIVRNGEIVGRGWNRVTSTNDPAAHAEVVANSFNYLLLERFWAIPKLEHSAKENHEMKRTVISGLLSALFTFFLASLVCAEGKEDKSLKALKVTKSTPKLEVRESQIGYRDTLLFYTFADQNAVLKLQIGNKDKSFPMSGTIYIFADSVKGDDLKKWLNNQHSDGLFPDVPDPISTHKIPETSCNVTSHKLIDRSKQEFGEYDNYSVTFDVKDYADKKSVALKGFSDTAKVHVKTK